MALNTPAKANETSLPFGSDRDDQNTGPMPINPQAYLDQLHESVPAPVWQQAAQGQDVNAQEAFSEDEYADVPKLEGDLWDMLVDKAEPIRFVHASYRAKSEFGPVWLMIVEVGKQPDHQQFALFFDAQYDARNERCAKVAAILQAGARSVGPFVLTETVGKTSGKGFKSFRAVPKTLSKK